MVSLVRKMVRFLVLLGVGASAVATTAFAQPTLTVRLDPNLAGRPSALVLEAEGEQTQGDSRTPKSAILSVQRGFKLDPRSRAARCSQQQAEDFNCPPASRIGAGTAVVTARGAILPGGSQDFTAQIRVFLAPRQRPNHVAGLAVSVQEPTTGTRGTSSGRIVPKGSGPYGYEIRFENLSGGAAPPPGITIELKRLELRVAAHRSVLVGRGKNRHRVIYSLITNPPTCDGTWNGRAELTFTDGSSVARATSVRCRGR
jgi:hypothetical protein